MTVTRDITNDFRIFESRGTCDNLNDFFDVGIVHFAVMIYIAFRKSVLCVSTHTKQHQQCC